MLGEDEDKVLGYHLTLTKNFHVDRDNEQSKIYSKWETSATVSGGALQGRSCQRRFPVSVLYKHEVAL